MTNGPRSFPPEQARTRLRATLAAVGRDLDALPSARTEDGRPGRPAVTKAFSDLVDQLALGPEPAVRSCPVCRHTGMRAATLCGYCWTKLVPPRNAAGVK